MVLRRLREICPDRVSCPNLFITDDGTFVVQGYVTCETRELANDEDQAVVEVPLALLPEAALQHCADLVVTDRDTVLVRGARLTDPEALAMIVLSANEAAVELTAAAMPTLVGVS